MFVTVLDTRSSTPKSAVSQLFLHWDNWNDFSFNTLFGVTYIDSNGTLHELGQVKIGYVGQKEYERSVIVGDSFNAFDSDHFSVGVDDEYYTNLNQLEWRERDRILSSLNDIAKDSIALKKAQRENVFKVSFLRGLSMTTITGQFRRLITGQARLTPYYFGFTSPSIKGSSPMNFTFNVKPLSNPPTNIHIIIGRNGVGKTFLINNMINSLTKPNDPDLKFGNFSSLENDNVNLFANLICVTFSAFDEFDHPPEVKDKSLGIQYSYIGLKGVQKDGTRSFMIDLKSFPCEFLNSLNACKNLGKSLRWQETIAILDTDPMFRSENVTTLIDISGNSEMKKESERIFKGLSSGHKLILLTLTKLVEKLEERSLVLIDEPESHLHPPLLSSFMRALTNLLVDRNAVAIIATHSPVVLQEVPRSCVYKLRRYGAEAIAERPEIESFGENTGVLTQEVFGLEVTDSGFHNILHQLVMEYSSYEQALEELKGQLGLEAKAILRGMFYQKDQKNASN